MRCNFSVHCLLLKQLELIDATYNIQNMIRDYTKKLAQIKNALYL